jgi:hypothetical protein
MNKKSQSKSPTPIGWVDYLDYWAESKFSKNMHLDYLDSCINHPLEQFRTRGPASNKELSPDRPSH